MAFGFWLLWLFGFWVFGFWLFGFLGRKEGRKLLLLQQLRLKGAKLPDTPTEPFPDKFVLDDSHRLTSLGCSSARQYYRTAAFDVFSDEAASVWYCMRQTLATYHQPDAKWSSTPDADVRRPPPGLAQQLRVLFLARDDPALFIGLKAVSCVSDSLLHLEPLRKLLSKYVLVVRGPVAADFWQVQDMDGNAPPYRQAVCFNCTTFSLHGSCENVHAAWLHGGQLDSRAAHIPALGRKRVPAQQAVPSVLRPGPAHQRARPSSSAFAPRSLLPTVGCDGLKSLLTSLGFDTFWPLFCKEQVNIATLAAWDLAAMKAYFPDVPGGLAAQILAACKNHAGHPANFCALCAYRKTCQRQSVLSKVYARNSCICHCFQVCYCEGILH